MRAKRILIIEEHERQSNSLETFGRGGEIRTHDPLRPSQIPLNHGNYLFSMALLSMRYGELVEGWRTLLKTQAPNSYKIVYSGDFPKDPRPLVRHHYLACCFLEEI